MLRSKVDFVTLFCLANSMTLTNDKLLPVMIIALSQEVHPVLNGSLDELELEFTFS